MVGEVDTNEMVSTLNLVFNKRRWRESILFSHTGLILKIIPVTLFLDHSWLQKSGDLEIANPQCGASFTRVDSLGGFTRIFILRENTHETRVVKFPRENWIPYLKITWGVTLGVRSVWRINSLNLHLLLLRFRTIETDDKKQVSKMQPKCFSVIPTFKRTIFVWS